MRRAIRLVVALLVGAGTVAGLRQVPELLSRLELFRVEAFKLEGARYLDGTAVQQLLSLDDDASVWDDPRLLEERLEAHVLVEEATIRHRLPETLIVEIRERHPIALVATPALEPVDADGKPLPIDPAAHRLDLPILRLGRSMARGGALLTPGQVRTMASELERLSQLDPEFVRSVSELVWEARGAILARLAEPSFEVRFRPPLAAQRLRQGLAVFADAMARAPGVVPTTVDLRFVDQVVVKLTRTNRTNNGAP